MGRQTRPLVERFWAKVDKRGPDDCWEWQARRNDCGYGTFRLNRERGTTGAHRLAWELTNGPIPEDRCVCHRCDNPPCVNPSHLFLGTHVDNMRDMRDKGRWKHRNPVKRGPVGEKHPSAKLTRADVLELRKGYTGSRGEQAELATAYGVSPGQMSRILSGNSWKHLLHQSPHPHPDAP